MVDQAGVEFDGLGVLFAAEVQRHLHGQLGLFVHALEVDVLHLRSERVHLHVTQQHLVGLAAKFHVQDGRVEGFFLESEPQRVVVKLDQGGQANAAIDDARGAAGVAETAARTRTLQGALESGEFHDDSLRFGVSGHRRVSGCAATSAPRFQQGRLGGKPRRQPLNATDQNRLA